MQAHLEYAICVKEGEEAKRMIFFDRTIEMSCLPSVGTIIDLTDDPMPNWDEGFKVTRVLFNAKTGGWHVDLGEESETVQYAPERTRRLVADGWVLWESEHERAGRPVS